MALYFQGVNYDLYRYDRVQNIHIILIKITDQFEMLKIVMNHDLKS